MVRKLAGVVFAVSTLHASVVSALGLGEMELKSGLNQPFQAEVSLNNLGDLNAQQIAVKLAASEDFDRAGVERVFFLSDLKFAVQLDGKGNGIVKISSKRLVREPYLDFILEARWPAGRMLREYTVLVDLPVFTDKATATPAPAVNTQARQSAVKPAPARARVPAPASSAAALPLPAPVEGEIVTQKSDTLWRLASRARPAGASMQQTMMAIYRNNPRAFARQNINGLRSGQVLRLPSAEQLDELSKQQAIQAVAMQNEAWKTGSTAPLEAGDTAAVQSSQAKAADEGYMKLSSAATADSSVAGSSGGSDEAADVEAVRSDLNAAQEKLDRASRENNELDGRLSDLEGQIDTLEKLIELKDSQLASLQGRLEQEASASEAAPVDRNFAEDSAPADMPASEIVEQESQPGIMDRLMSPLYLGGFGLLVLLAAAGLMMKRRSAEDGDDGDWQQALAVAEDEDQPEDDTAAVFATLVGDTSGEQAADELDSEEPQLSTPDAGPEQDDSDAAQFDPLAEAEMYCSYDRHDEAVVMLQKAIEKEPGRDELQLKLMSIFAELDRESEFNEVYGGLAASGNDDSLHLADELAVGKGWLQVGSETDTTLVSTAGASDEEAALGEEIDNTDLDFDLDFDLSDVDSLDDTAQHTALDLAVDNLDLEDDAGLDFDISLPSDSTGVSPDNAETNAETNAELDNLDFDIQPDDGDTRQGDNASALADMLDAGDDLDDNLSEMVDGDEIATKLDLARAYVDMGDVDGARDILEEVLQDGSEVQVEEANTLLRDIAS